MAAEKYDTLQLVGLHEPDSSLENGPDGNKVAVPLPGMYSVGAMINGVFVKLGSYKAGNLVDDKNVVKPGTKSSSSGE